MSVTTVTEEFKVTVRMPNKRARYVLADDFRGKIGPKEHYFIFHTYEGNNGKAYDSEAEAREVIVELEHKHPDLNTSVIKVTTTIEEEEV